MELKRLTQKFIVKTDTEITVARLIELLESDASLPEYQTISIMDCGNNEFVRFNDHTIKWDGCYKLIFCKDETYYALYLLRGMLYRMMQHHLDGVFEVRDFTGTILYGYDFYSAEMNKFKIPAHVRREMSTTGDVCTDFYKSQEDSFKMVSVSSRFSSMLIAVSCLMWITGSCFMIQTDVQPIGLWMPALFVVVILLHILILFGRMFQLQKNKIAEKKANDELMDSFSYLAHEPYVISQSVFGYLRRHFVIGEYKMENVKFPINIKQQTTDN